MSARSKRPVGVVPPAMTLAEQDRQRFERALQAHVLCQPDLRRKSTGGYSGYINKSVDWCWKGWQLRGDPPPDPNCSVCHGTGHPVPGGPRCGHCD